MSKYMRESLIVRIFTTTILTKTLSGRSPTNQCHALYLCSFFPSGNWLLILSLHPIPSDTKFKGQYQSTVRNALFEGGAKWISDNKTAKDADIFNCRPLDLLGAAVAARHNVPSAPPPTQDLNSCQLRWGRKHEPKGGPAEKVWESLT